MKIYFFCPRWGSEHISWKDFCSQVSAAGYSGIETPIPLEPESRDEIKDALEQYGLLLIGQYYQSFEKDFQTHKSNFRLHLENMRLLDCMLIDSQTGKDYYSMAQNVELFQIAHQFSIESGITIAHETHRNKALYAAHRFGELVENFPKLKITADFFHWCCVSESLLEQQAEVMRVAISKAVHIHARVGHEESPQVSDPSAPEYREAFSAHLQWWDRIVSLRREQGASFATITPEFGPPPYMPTIPFSKTPLANQWELNLFMMDYLKKRYN
jgi:sugar phosphate isomerase/epimerase